MLALFPDLSDQLQGCSQAVDEVFGMFVVPWVFRRALNFDVVENILKTDVMVMVTTSRQTGYANRKECAI